MTGQIPAVVAGLCDDAAMFPPGLAPLPDAVDAYRARVGTWYADLVGPLVLPVTALPALRPLLPDEGPPLPLSVTLPQGPDLLPDVLAAPTRLPCTLRAVEVAVPDGMPSPAFFSELDAAVEGVSGLDIYVEVPRDERRSAIFNGIAGRYRAKFRTGGVRAELYPDEAELAAAVAAAVAAGVPFKATAGLHHAVRNTDPETGFEQHGFLNLLLATHTLLTGGSVQDAAVLLAERDGTTVAGLIADLQPQPVTDVRTAFTSFGTCSVTDPLTDLVQLGLVTTPAKEGATT